MCEKLIFEIFFTYLSIWEKLNKNTEKWRDLLNNNLQPN